MTLIIGMVNRSRAVLVADRRISKDGKIVRLPAFEQDGFEERDESNKQFFMISRDARLAVGFCGLAGNGKDFLAKKWIPQALLASAPPDYLMIETLKRFAKRATEKFAEITVDPPLDKRLSVVFAGFSYDEVGPRAFSSVVSNLEDIHGDLLAGGQAAPEFKITVAREKRPPEDVASLLIIAGNDRAITQETISSLIDLIRQDKPAHALIGKAVDVIRDASRSAKSGNTVGQQCCSITVPSAPQEGALGEYHSAKIAYRYYTPDFIKADNPESRTWIMAEPRIEFRDAIDKPIAISGPKVRGRAPCPCGSGRKYKHCHGRKRKR